MLSLQQKRIINNMAAILTQKTVKALGIATLVILTVGGGMLVGQPLYNSIQTQAEELDAANSSITTLEASKTSLEKSKADYPAVAAIDATLLGQFPQLAEVPVLLDVITAGAVSTGVSPSAISSMTFSSPAIAVPVIAPVAEVAPEEGAETDAAAEAAPPADVSTVATTGEFATMEVGLSISGSPTQMQDFLKYLNTMDRAMTITGFSIADGEAGAGSKTLSLTGTVFIYKAIPTPTDVSAGTGVPVEEEIVTN